MQQQPQLNNLSILPCQVIEPFQQTGILFTITTAWFKEPLVRMQLVDQNAHPIQNVMFNLKQQDIPYILDLLAKSKFASLIDHISQFNHTEQARMRLQYQNAFGDTIHIVEQPYRIKSDNIDRNSESDNSNNQQQTQQNQYSSYTILTIQNRQQLTTIVFNLPTYAFIEIVQQLILELSVFVNSYRAGGVGNRARRTGSWNAQQYQQQPAPQPYQPNPQQQFYQQPNAPQQSYQQFPQQQAPNQSQQQDIGFTNLDDFLT